MSILGNDDEVEDQTALWREKFTALAPASQGGSTPPP